MALVKLIMIGVNVNVLLKLSTEKYYILIEELASRFCGLDSSKKEFGLEKSIIRFYILNEFRTMAKQERT